MAWPPTLDELKLDMRDSGVMPLSPGPAEDARLQQTLDAAVSYIEDVRPVFRYDATDPDQLELPEPTKHLRLGTLRLAIRWHARRRSQDAMINMGEMGATRVSTGDVDIDRMLGIGRFRPMTESFA